MNVNLSFPIKEVRGAKWCSLANMGVKRLEIVAYRVNIKEQYTFAGGHRHRCAIAQDDIHLLFPTETFDIPLDIKAVTPSSGPPKRRHDKR